MISSYFIDKDKYNLDVAGDIVAGNNEILSENEINLCKKTNWCDSGYFVSKILNDNDQVNLRNEITNFLIKTLKNTFSHLSNVNVDSLLTDVTLSPLRPHGLIFLYSFRLLLILIEQPWYATHLLTRTPIAAIFLSLTHMPIFFYQF